MIGLPDPYPMLNLIVFVASFVIGFLVAAAVSE
jgi:hypothetical protein